MNPEDPKEVEQFVYIGSDDDSIYCLYAGGDPAGPGPGLVKWSHATGADVRSSPAIAEAIPMADTLIYQSDKTVYIGSDDNNLYALDAYTGILYWNYLTAGDIFSSPAVAVDIREGRGLVWVGSTDGNVYCLHAGLPPQGEPRLIWSYPTASPVYSSPAVVLPDSLADGVLYIGSDNRRLYALNAETGEHLWNRLLSGSIFSSPAISYGKVFVGADSIYAFLSYPVPVAQEVGLAPLPKTCSLLQNYPNPFNSTTLIRCTLPDRDREGRPHRTSLKVYNLLGQLVKTLVDGEQEPGYHSVHWDGRNGLGKDVSSGIYFCKLQAGDNTSVRKMILLK